MITALAHSVKLAVSNFLWKMLTPQFNARLTDRLLDFYDGLLERGQIAAPTPGAMRLAASKTDAGHSLAGTAIQLGRVLPFAGRPDLRKTQGPEHV